MARVILLWWVLLVSFQTLYQGLVYSYYVCNKAYIIEQLCENKNQPQLKCDGKCHLKKVLQVQAKKTPQEQPNQPYLPNLEDVKLPPLFFQAAMPFVALCRRLCWQNGTSRRFDYLFCYTYEPSLPVWNPPRLG